MHVVSKMKSGTSTGSAGKPRGISAPIARRSPPLQDQTAAAVARNKYDESFVSESLGRAGNLETWHKKKKSKL
jgi:hypothetical protein